MTVVTSTFNPPNQPGMMVDSRALAHVRAKSPVDSLEDDVASYIESSGSKESHVEAWDSKPTKKQIRRSSKVERVARSEGHEDSFGLVKS